MCCHVVIDTYGNIGTDKPFHTGIIVPGIEIIPACLRVVVVAPIPDGVDVGNVGGAGDGVATGVGDGQDVAPGIVGIPGHNIAVGIQNGDDVPLQVLQERIPYPIVADRTDASASIVVIVQMVGSVVPSLVYQIPRSVPVELGYLHPGGLPYLIVSLNMQ